ncbi:MAG: ABC transporter ATP-binding protein [Fimbriimonas sp.]|nr:ABC transporter ATP-binding protein [Fimbriimonas sp.]
MRSSPVSKKVSRLSEFEIECKGLTKRFGAFTAVDGISFGVKRGEIFGFLGPNGCGKSTTIRMILGLLSPSSGSTYVAGMDSAKDSDKIRQRVGYMSQKFSLYDDLTVKENLDFFAGIYGMHGSVRRARIDEVTNLIDLTEFKNALVASLSTGLRQRLALGASILHSPEILILDEPTSGVDPLSRRRLWNLINELANRGRTILVTTHAMDEAEHCHRVTMMQSGHVVCTGSPEDLRANQVEGIVYTIDCHPLFPALSAAESINGVVDASVLGSRLHIRVPTGGISPESICESLRHSGIMVSGFGLGETTLEDVFVAVAGEAS